MKVLRCIRLTINIRQLQTLKQLCQTVIMLNLFIAIGGLNLILIVVIRGSLSTDINCGNSGGANNFNMPSHLKLRNIEIIPR